MSDPIRVMVEQGKKRAVASAFDWPGWDRNGKSEDQALAVLATYRARYARVAVLAGLEDEFLTTGELAVVERTEGTGMTDFHGVSATAAASEHGPMSRSDCERKLSLLQACWSYFDGVASRVSPELREGPRGGGRDRDRIIQHTNRVEILDFAKKVGVVAGEEVWLRPDELGAYRDSFCAAIREHNARGAPARTWSVQFLIRRCAYHMCDHAWELEDRDLT